MSVVVSGAAEKPGALFILLLLLLPLLLLYPSNPPLRAPCLSPLARVSFAKRRDHDCGRA